MEVGDLVLGGGVVVVGIQGEVGDEPVLAGRAGHRVFLIIVEDGSVLAVGRKGALGRVAAKARTTSLTQDEPLGLPGGDGLGLGLRELSLWSAWDSSPLSFLLSSFADLPSCALAKEKQRRNSFRSLGR